MQWAAKWASDFGEKIEKAVGKMFLRDLIMIVRMSVIEI